MEEEYRKAHQSSKCIMSSKTVKIYNFKVTLFTPYALQSSIHFSTNFTKISLWSIVNLVKDIILPLSSPMRFLKLAFFNKHREAFFDLVIEEFRHHIQRNPHSLGSFYPLCHLYLRVAFYSMFFFLLFLKSLIILPFSSPIKGRDI